jgi:hypothetical protein
MHISKHSAFLAMIGYLVARIALQDWWLVTQSTGRADILALAWFGASMLLIRLAGSALFADSADDSDTELVIHPEDLHFTDTGLFLLALADIGASLAWHIYLEITSTDLAASYYLLWIAGEALLFGFTLIMFWHAQKTQRKLAKASRKAYADAEALRQAQASHCAAGQPIAGRDRGPSPSNFRQVG